MSQNTWEATDAELAFREQERVKREAARVMVHDIAERRYTNYDSEASALAQALIDLGLIK